MFIMLQVVTLALYTYFIAALLGRQFVPEAIGPVGKFEEPDMYFPFFTALQVNFVMLRANQKTKCYFLHSVGEVVIRFSLCK